MRTWIKLYTEILHDPKMHALTDKQFRSCINLFALAGYKDNDGIIGTFDEIRFHLRLPRRDTESVLKRLESVAVLQFDEPNYTVTAFLKRNGTSPSQSNEKILQRVREFRARKQGESENGNESVTLLHSERNESVTPLDKNRIDKNRLHADEPPESHKETCPAEWMTVLYQMTQTDPAVATVAQRSNLSACGKALIKGGASLEMLEAFSRNWYALDWRGKKGQPPTAKQVRDEWGKYSKSQNGNGNGLHEVEYEAEYTIGYAPNGKQIQIPIGKKP